MFENAVPVEISEFYGLNTKQSKAKMAPGFSSDLHDIDLSQPGIAKVRGGASILNAYTPPGFGNGALQLDGVSQYASVPDSTAFDFSGGTWGIAIYGNLDSLNTLNTLFSQVTDSSNYKVAWIASDGSVHYKVVASASTVVSMASSAGAITAQTNFFLEFDESGNNYYIFLNGAQIATTSDTDREANYTGTFDIGRLNVSGSEGYFPGHLDEIVVKKTVALHTAAFTPPTSAYTSDSNTSLLLHFEGDDQQTTTTDSSGTPKTVTLQNGAKLHVGTMSFTPRRLHDYYKPSVDLHTAVGCGGTKVFSIVPSGRWKVIDSGFTSDAIMDFLNFKDNLYYSNGFDAARVFNGTSSRNWGIVAPVAAPTVSAGAGGSLNGAYQYAFTYYNSTTLHESTRSPLSILVNPSAQVVNLSALTASADPQVDKIRIYRTTAGGATFLLLDTINNGTTTYTDNLTDVNLGSSEAPEDNDPPPLFAGIEEWDGRIFGFKRLSTSVQFCNDEFLTAAGSGIPEESFSPDNDIQFNAAVFGIKKAPTFNELWVHTNKGIYAIKQTGVPDSPYYVVVRNTTWFSVSHYSIENIYNDQWFMGDNAKVISVDNAGNIHYESYFIEPTLYAANKTKFSKLQACHYRGNSKNQFRLIFPSSGQTDPDTMLAANYLQRTPPSEENAIYQPVQYPVWELHNIPATCMEVIKDSSLNDVLYSGHTDGTIRQQDTGTNDGGSAINWSFSLGWTRTYAQASKTMFPRKVELYFNPLGDWNFSMRTDFDFGAGGGQVYSLKAKPTGDTFDFTLTFDTSVFAALSPLKKVIQDLGGAYNFVELTFFGNVKDQGMELHPLSIISIPIEGYRDKNG